MYIYICIYIYIYIYIYIFVLSDTNSMEQFADGAEVVEVT